MSGFVEFLENLLHERLSDIDIGMVGRIESFDKQQMRADVTPLMKKESGNDVIEYSTIKDIPVNFLISGDYYIRPDYKSGDLVHIAFSTHDIEDALKDRKPLESKKIFSSENAFVVSGIAKTYWNPPAEFSKDGLLMGHKGGNAFIQFDSDKITMNFGDQNNIEFSPSGIKVTVGGVSYDFVTHTHNSAAPGSPTGPPIQSQ